MGGKRFHVVNLGCKVNKVEADILSASLAAAGHVPSREEDADLVIVNTCTVTGEADKKARKAVRRALAANGRAHVVVTGCAAAINPAVFTAMDERVEVVQRGDLPSLRSEARAAPALRLGEGFRTRVNMKVQDGCDHACTYCIVHVARGKATSRPLADAVAEARAYFKHGVKEVVLAGIDLASYRDGDSTLATLTERLLEEADKANAPGEPPARIRVSSVEPQNLDEGFIELLARSGGRICRHLHLPLQSGNDKVLHEMARPYSAGYYADLVAHLRALLPCVSITTDVICGFPGETEGEFEDTMELAARCRFSKVHVFPYSRRAGTPAAGRHDQVTDSVKAQRAARLRELASRMRKADLEARRGSVELALVEDDHALTESYHEVAIPAGARRGELVRHVFA